MNRPRFTTPVRERSGFLALGALLVVVTVLALLTGVLILSGSTLKEARAFRDVRVARFLAEGSVREVGAAPAFAGSHELWASRPVLSGDLSRGHSRAVHVRLLGREYALVEGTGVAGSDSARVTLARTAWRMDAVSRLDALGGAVLGYGGILQAFGSVTGSTVRQPPEGWPTGICRSEAPALDSIFPSGSVEPYRPIHYAPPDSIPGLGLLRGASIAAMAPPHTGSVTPMPKETEGVCQITDPLNWGSPSTPEGPCGAYFPVKTTRGSSALVGGEGQGILYAAGDLDITAGHRFVGVLLVAGDLTVADGSLVEGFVRASGSIRIGATARVHASGCGALLPLRDLERVVPPMWIPERAWMEPL